MLENAEYVYYPSGHTIFRQGDYGDKMYIILRGSCNVKIKRKTFMGTTENILASVLFDGAHFGELSMLGSTAKKPKKSRKDALGEAAEKQGEEGMDTLRTEEVHNENETEGTSKEEEKNKENNIYQERSRRGATVEVAESVDLLCVPRDTFKDIFLNLIQKELDSKLKLLMTLPFFGVKHFSIFIIA